jgi:hypothetical protein
MICVENGDDSVSMNTYLQTYKGGGDVTEGGGGFRSKCQMDTVGQPYLTISHASQGFQNNISDRVR